MRNNPYFKEIFAVNQKQDSVMDAVRAFSVLSIIAFHVVVGVLSIFNFEKSKEYILSMPRILQPLWQGEKGVDAFFLVSAIVLGIPLFTKLESFDWSATKSFYKRRFFRIYPLFFTSLVLYTAGQWSYFGKYFLSNMLLINNLIPGERTIIPVGWSLLVEVQYYAILPVFIWLLQRAKSKTVFLSTVFLSSFAVCAWRLLSYPELYIRPMSDIFLAEDHSKFLERFGELIYSSNLTRYGPFVLGLLIAYIKERKGIHLRRLFNSSFVSISSFIMGVFLVVLSIGLPIYEPTSFFYNPFSEKLNFLFLMSHRQVFTMGLGLLILGCWFSDWYGFSILKKISSWRFWLPFSRLSFPIYLFHFPMIIVAAVVVFGTTNAKSIDSVSFFQGLGIYVVGTFLTVLFSIPLYVYLERPLVERGRTKSK